MILYHLRYVCGLDKKKKLKVITNLTARIPESAVYEDDTTKRICFATSIENCLKALQGDLGIYQVYKLDTEKQKVNLYKPKCKEVFDAKINEEYWVLDDKVAVEYIGIVKCIDCKIVKEHRINRKPYRFYSREVEYSWI